MRKKQKKKKQAFSLMELLVVVAILGILATVFTFYFAGSRKKAQDARRKSDVLGIREALEMYYDDHGEYPNESIFPPSNPEDPFEADGIVYMDKVPDDPKEDWDYDYESDGTYYRLYARLENENDDDVAEGVYPDSDCTGSDPSCNYGGTSPNTSLPDPVLEPTPGPTSPPSTPTPEPTSSPSCICPCSSEPGFDNFCFYPPDTPNCTMTYSGGYCDPNGDGDYSDGDWNRGWYEYYDCCSDN